MSGGDAPAAVETALVPVDKGTPLPAFTGPEMARALVAYRELQKTLDASMPDQIMQLDGKPFRKKGYWRAIAVAFNLRVELVSETQAQDGSFNDNQPNFGWHVTYRASTSTGRCATGDGSCFAIEKAKRRGEADPWETLPKQATQHNIRSHAHTRAFNRAVSNLVAFGEVSAEEIDRDERDEAARIAELRPDPPTTFIDAKGTPVPERPPPTTFIDAKGTPVPERPPPPPGFYYIDEYNPGAKFHEITFNNFLGPGRALKLSSQYENVWSVAQQAYQFGQPVKPAYKMRPGEVGLGWLQKLTVWKPPSPEEPVLIREPGEEGVL